MRPIVVKDAVRHCAYREDKCRGQEPVWGFKKRMTLQDRDGSSGYILLGRTHGYGARRALKIEWGPAGFRKVWANRRHTMPVIAIWNLIGEEWHSRVQ
jgi:hypothetical protein